MHDGDNKQTGAAVPVGLAPWLGLWGAVWVIRALADFAAQWVDTSLLKTGITGGAGAVSAVGLIVWLLRRPQSEAQISARTAAGKAVLPVLAVLGSVWLLDYVHAVDAFFAPLFRTLMLAVCFIYAGTTEGRAFLLLGLWLFAAAAVTGIWYLGYSPLVLEGLGGLALLAAFLLLKQQRR